MTDTAPEVIKSLAWIVAVREQKKAQLLELRRQARLVNQQIKSMSAAIADALESNNAV